MDNPGGLSKRAVLVLLTLICFTARVMPMGDDKKETTEKPSTRQDERTVIGTAVPTEAKEMTGTTSAVDKITKSSGKSNPTTVADVGGTKTGVDTHLATGTSGGAHLATGTSGGAHLATGTSGDAHLATGTSGDAHPAGEHGKDPQLENQPDQKKDAKQEDSPNDDVGGSSHFLVVLLVSATLVFTIYIGYHRRRKVMSWFSERKPTTGTRSKYRRLETQDDGWDKGRGF
uniref:trans-Golgi network integral membrane protein 1-like n=1 Tax=Myxine glutinosa TaxID=7769 RepID=UPI00358F4049